MNVILDPSFRFYFKLLVEFSDKEATIERRLDALLIVIQDLWSCQIVHNCKNK